MARTHTVIESPVGGLTVVAEDGLLSGLYFEGHKRGPGPEALGMRSEESFEETRRQLDEYFAGERTEFSLPLAPRGSEFQQRVWMLLREIPFGETRSYGELALELGGMSLARAVGAANGRNPLSIIVPCHRVVGSNSDLTGFGGGVERKRFLLDLEQSTVSSTATLF
jgi:methylated-DNA-[protein]-cysteine S-methyltransferase